MYFTIVYGITGIVLLLSACFVVTDIIEFILTKKEWADMDREAEFYKLLQQRRKLNEERKSNSGDKGTR